MKKDLEKRKKKKQKKTKNEMRTEILIFLSKIPTVSKISIVSKYTDFFFRKIE